MGLEDDPFLLGRQKAYVQRAWTVSYVVLGANYFPDLVLTKSNPTFYKIQEATCVATPQSIFATSAPETPQETATRWTPSPVINWVMGPL